MCNDVRILGAQYFYQYDSPSKVCPSSVCILKHSAVVLIMPGVIQETQFKTITAKELHPTFAVEIEDVNFQDLSEKKYGDIIQAMGKV
jgi:hypothetical protein